ncbi:hypothetical protein A0H81_12676, partial [Grifola frondosa]
TQIRVWFGRPANSITTIASRHERNVHHYHSPLFVCYPSPSKSHPTYKDSQSGSSHAEIWRWTLTKDAIAPCFVRDVIEMRESTAKDAEYFWLGRVPCRSVRLVGIIVGVQTYERRTLYTLDDGTGVVDCSFRHPNPQPSPSKRQSRSTDKGKGKEKEKYTSKNTPSFADYLPPPRSTPASSTSSKLANFLQGPRPIAEVGMPVCVVGRVTNKHKERFIVIDTIGKSCHEIAYLQADWDHPDRARTLGLGAHTAQDKLLSLWCRGRYAFHRPALRTISAAVPVPDAQCDADPSATGMPQVPTTPVSVRSMSVDGSPSTVAEELSPKGVVGEEGKQSPPRLRHPVRLRTRDLTANTFRIYLKHYMDHAPVPPVPQRSRSRSVSPTPYPRSSRGGLETPTKSRSCANQLDAEPTPRPTRMTPMLWGDRTPRTSTLNAVYMIGDMDDDDERIFGCTLGHLRRVPELALLARRVVDAEGRRRVREERKRAREAGTNAREQQQKESERAMGPRGPRMKRLFQYAVRELFKEGSIVLWDGPVRPHPAPASALPSASQLWKANTSGSTAASASTISTGSAIRYERYDDEMDELSDAPPGEEAYVPLTPVYFAPVVENAIRDIMASHARAPPPTKRTHTGVVLAHLLAQQDPGSPPGPTPGELLAWLRRRDERWARVGEWSVNEALEWESVRGAVVCGEGALGGVWIGVATGNYYS